MSGKSKKFTATLKFRRELSLPTQLGYINAFIRHQVISLGIYLMDRNCNFGDVCVLMGGWVGGWLGEGGMGELTHSSGKMLDCSQSPIPL